MSENKQVISSILGVSVKSSEERELETSEPCLPQETDQGLDDTSKSTCSITHLEKNQMLKKDTEVEIMRTCETLECNFNMDASDDSKPESDIKEDPKSTSIDISEQAASLEVTNGRGDVQQSNGELPSKRIADVISGRFGEGGDTLLHVASRSSRTEIMLRLLECGADPAVK